MIREPAERATADALDRDSNFTIISSWGVSDKCHDIVYRAMCHDIVYSSLKN
jgi:hypothetical protein